MPRIAACCAILLSFGFASPAHADGDPAAGKKVFAKCAACHVLSSDGKHKIGPNLRDVLGRRAGTATGYKYSKAMREADVVWNAESLDSYLADPKGFVPGNKMPFPGLKAERERSDVIAYLREVGRP